MFLGEDLFVSQARHIQHRFHGTHAVNIVRVREEAFQKSLLNREGAIFCQLGPAFFEFAFQYQSSEQWPFMVWIIDPANINVSAQPADEVGDFLVVISRWVEASAFVKLFKRRGCPACKHEYCLSDHFFYAFVKKLSVLHRGKKPTQPSQ